MASDLTISIDAMGGDNAPDIVVEGLGLALVRHPGLKAILFGDERAIAPLLQKSPAVAKISQIRHTEGRVSGGDKPSEAVRRGRQTSMWLAIDAVRNSEAAVAVSAGNTGALMAMAKIQLKTMPGITRPAIAAIWPTVRGQSVVLDLGANSENDEKELVDFAIMGEAFAKVMFGLERPTVALLNIGTEELKGRDEIRAAAQLIRDSRIDMNFAGYVEGSDIGMGKVDVVVADGFTGNVALKTAEGTAKQIATYLRASLTRSLASKLGALLARGAFEALRTKMDPRTFNGGVFLGLNGLVVKSHGGTDGVGFASALDIAIDMASSDFARSISERLTALGTRATDEAAAPAPSTIGSAHGSSYTAAAS